MKDASASTSTLAVEQGPAHVGARAASIALPTMLALGAGLFFGIGLIVSALTDPARVLAFLDVAGAWDASLLLTMAAAVTIGLGAFAVAQRRTRSLLGLPLHLPTATAIDRRLAFGAVLFGIGWGLAGICPGPAFVALGTGSTAAALFVAAMIAGMVMFDRAEFWLAARASTLALPDQAR